MVLRKEDARFGDRIEPLRRLCFLVVNNVAKLIFFERLDLHQDDIANDRVENLCVVERLIGIVYRFGVNSRTVIGIVFDLDSKVTANRFDVDAIFNRNVRMQATAMKLTRCALPSKIMLRRILDFVVATIVDVF